MINKKTLLSTFGVIVLGALGSALWELGKPLLASFVTAVAELSTLGVKSLQNDFYIRAARTLGRPTGWAQSTALLAGFTAMVGCMLSTQFDERYESRLTKWTSALLLFSGIVFLIQAVHITYSMRLATYFELLEVQAAPHTSDLEQKKNRAMFSRVSSKEDYDRVIDTLSSKIRSAGELVPDPR